MSIKQNTKLICTKSEDYPIYIRDVRERHSNVSFSSHPTKTQLENLGYELVEKVEKPTSETGRVTEGPPELIDGVWKQTWNFEEYTDQEIVIQLEYEKKKLRRDINDLRDLELYQGIEYTFPGDVVEHILLRPEDRIVLIGQRMQARELESLGDSNSTLTYRTYENTTWELTASEMISLTDYALSTYEQIYVNSWIIKDQIEDAEDKESLPNVPTTLIG